MPIMGSIAAYLGELTTFSQTLVALPLVLDLLGPPAFLLLSLLLTGYHFAASTIRLATKGTPLGSITSLIGLLNPFVTPALFLVTLHYHLRPATKPSPEALLPSPSYVLTEILPYFYAATLRWVSPLFTLLEGISTLLVVQVAGRAGKGWADDEEKEEGMEWRSMLALVVAAGVYSAGLLGAYKVFPVSVESALPAFLLGAALTTVLFLSFIGFSLRRTNVLETSLVFVYVIYSAWLSGVEGAMEPRNYGEGWLMRGWATANTITEPNVSSLLSRAVAHVSDGLTNVTHNLPPHLLLSLVYRLTVLHLASRIVPMIRAASAGWEDDIDDGSGEFGTPTTRITTVVLSYRRAILITVYTHLLLLDGGSQTWWRWGNVALFLSVWAIELLVDENEDKWKVD